MTKAFADRRGITYTLLSDPKSVVIERWGLRDPQYPTGSRAFGVPRPIIFVLDRRGMIRASIAEETYQKRPPVAEVVKLLDAIPQDPRLGRTPLGDDDQASASAPSQVSHISV